MFDPASEDTMLMETSEHLAHNDTSMDSATPLCGMLQHLHLDDALAPTDVTFLIGGETFTAHRSVLAARSPAFAAELFRGDTNTRDCIRIDDMTAQVFKTVLHFIYTGSIPPEMEHGLKTMAALLAAADRLGLQELKDTSEQGLQSRMSR
ncbi:hypothetical protein QOZ80_2AG0117420 [Eleusine coracana subsp. coracana]|nr:hypothetical protein QOZ80_2AG0117420 [Eleusine coracana subsp. coracana]